MTENNKTLKENTVGDYFKKVEAKLPPEKVTEAYKKAETRALQYQLAQMRKDLGIRQEDIEGFSQESISRIENRTDIKLSTLIDYLSNLNVGLEIIAYPHKKGRKKDSYTLLKI